MWIELVVIFFIFLVLTSSESRLYRAAMHGDLERVRELLKAGVNPNYGRCLGPRGILMSKSPIYVASQRGHSQIISELVKVGVKANCGMEVLGGLLKSESPLYIASRCGNASAVDVLVTARAILDAGISHGPNGLFRYQSPLSAATLNRQTDVVIALKKAGASMSLKWLGVFRC
jgi:hypothetical protein